MEWCGMAWREMACTRQYGVVWSGLAWHVTAWHGMEGSNGMSWNGMARPMMAWDGLAAHRRAGVVVVAISEARMATKKKRSKSCRRVSTSETRRRGDEERRNAGTQERRNEGAKNVVHGIRTRDGCTAAARDDHYTTSDSNDEG